MSPFIVFQHAQKSFLDSVRPRLTDDNHLKSSGMTLYFPPDANPPQVKLVVRSDLLPVILYYQHNAAVTGSLHPPKSDPTTLAMALELKPSFDFESYKQNLRTKRLGNVIMYTDVVSTTMALFDRYHYYSPISRVFYAKYHT